MSNNTTEVVFILDRSGSMAGLESDTIGGFNGMLKKQKEEEGRAYLTTVLFDDRYELLHNRIDIREAGELTDKQYYVRGCTALLDAVGYTIQKIAHEKEDGSKVIFIITTDGYENASHEYSYASLKKLIEKKKEEGWEFIFLGANIDAAATAGRFGVNADRAANFHNDSSGIEVNYKAITKAVGAFRRQSKVDGNWAEEIASDYEKRK